MKDEDIKIYKNSIKNEEGLEIEEIIIDDIDTPEKSLREFNDAYNKILSLKDKEEIKETDIFSKETLKIIKRFERKVLKHIKGEYFDIKKNNIINKKKIAHLIEDLNNYIQIYFCIEAFEFVFNDDEPEKCELILAFAGEDIKNFGKYRLSLLNKTNKKELIASIKNTCYKMISEANIDNLYNLEELVAVIKNNQNKERV